MLNDKMLSSVLIFGKLPPPIGGVTTSIKNLVEILASNNIYYRIFDYKLSELLCFFRFYDLAHVNSSSRLKRLISIILGRIFSKKVIFLIHGSRFDSESILNRICLKFTSGVVVLNETVKGSVLSAGFCESKVFLQSPVFKFKTSKVVGSGFNFLKEKYQGSNIVTLYSNHDGYLDGKEVYGFTFFFSTLINCFEKFDAVFVVVDLSGKFKSLIKSLSDKYTIIYYDNPVDFSALLSCSDIYVRPTNFDGSSVAVLEALQHNVKVIASDVVDRPKGVFIYDVDDVDSFCNALERSRTENVSNEKLLTDFSDFVTFYNYI